MMMPIILFATFTAGMGAGEESAAVRSVAVRVHHTEAMLAFYSEAFGIEFAEVELNGLSMYEGRLGSTLFKFVPIREEDDFSGFPVHQLGFTVTDLSEVIRLAEDHGGRLLEQLAATDESPPVAAIRDPDGNSIELHARR